MQNWEVCLDEVQRVLRPLGVLYLSTSNKLCPRQNEFDLPLYSWYPGALKRHFVQLAVTRKPGLVQHAQYPAVNWFSYYSLRNALAERGFESFDRFDTIDEKRKGAIARCVIGAVRKSRVLRWLGQVATPYTLVVAVKQR